MDKIYFKDNNLKVILVNSKHENIQKLYQARKDHLKWLNDIKFQLSKVNLNNELTIPVLYESEVGKWFYSNALQFSQFKSRIVLDEMEKLLEEMFDIYSNIYPIFNNKKESKIRSLFGAKNVVSNYEKKLASQYYEKLVPLSDNFKNKLKVLESQMMILSDEKHELIQDFNTKKDKVSGFSNNESKGLKEYNYGPRG